MKYSYSDIHSRYKFYQLFIDFYKNRSELLLLTNKNLKFHDVIRFDLPYYDIDEQYLFILVLNTRSETNDIDPVLLNKLKKLQTIIKKYTNYSFLITTRISSNSTIYVNLNNSATVLTNPKIFDKVFYSLLLTLSNNIQ